MPCDVLKFSSRITALPIVHGNGDFSIEVRRLMLREPFDCLAVPLPPSFQPAVENAITHLSMISLVIQESTIWSEPSADAESEGEEISGTVSYVPIDPCQGVITALKIAIQEGIPRAFIEPETDPYEPCTTFFPDPYALKKVPIEKFAAALLPAIVRLPEGQPIDRVTTMGAQLQKLEERFSSILLVCSLTDWPWIRQAYKNPASAACENDPVAPPAIVQPTPETLFFILGELPFITGLYERAGKKLEADENLTIDGIKELLVATRRKYKEENKNISFDLSPQTLSLLLRYVRNLSLIHNRLTPDLYTLCTAAQQIAGDGFALELIETARRYPYQDNFAFPRVACGINKLRVPDQRIMNAVSRLPGPPITWGKLKLKPRPPKIDQKKWRYRWNPYSQCSHLPEDTSIERFRRHVFDRARSIMGMDLAHSEKFTTSIKDGLDIRETLRHFYTGDIYVKVNPPVRGTLDCVVLLFDTPADPRNYPWRTTWFAEHEEESTLAFFATDYMEDLVGPGIGRARYGGALLIYPPITIPNIWTDKRLDFTDTLEERLLAASCVYSESSHIAVLSPAPPNAVQRALARRFKRKWVHLPMHRFSASLLRKLQIVHVLNGKYVRSYADYFIRKG